MEIFSKMNSKLISQYCSREWNKLTKEERNQFRVASKEDSLAKWNLESSDGFSRKLKKSKEILMKKQKLNGRDFQADDDSASEEISNFNNEFEEDLAESKNSAIEEEEDDELSEEICSIHPDKKNLRINSKTNKNIAQYKDTPNESEDEF